MQSEANKRVQQLFTGTAGGYDRVVRWATLGMDYLWKRRMLAIIEEERRDKPTTGILDLACGTGILTFELARRFPEATVVGVDLMPEYLAIARRRARLLDLADRVHFVHLPAEDIDKLGISVRWELPHKYQLVTSSYLPKYVDARTLARNCAQVLEVRGTLVLHDFTYPSRSLLARGYDVYWAMLSRLLWLRRPWREMARGLKDVIRGSGWTDEVPAWLRWANFRDVRVEPQPLQIAAILRATAGSYVRVNLQEV